MILVLGSVRVRADVVDEALVLAREHVARSRAEPGCLAHAVHRDEDDLARLVFVERWADLEALETHFAVPASRDFGRRLQAFAIEPPTLEIFDAAPIVPPSPRRPPR